MPYTYKALVNNLARSSDRILSTCKDNLRDKVHEGLTGVLPIEAGEPLVLKLMLDIVMNVDKSDLRLLTKNLQTLRLKDIPDENVSTIVSYLKGGIASVGQLWENTHQRDGSTEWHDVFSSEQ